MHILNFLFVFRKANPFVGATTKSAADCDLRPIRFRLEIIIYCKTAILLEQDSCKNAWACLIVFSDARRNHNIFDAVTHVGPSHIWSSSTSWTAWLSKNIRCNIKDFVAREKSNLNWKKKFSVSRVISNKINHNQLVECICIKSLRNLKCATTWLMWDMSMNKWTLNMLPFASSKPIVWNVDCFVFFDSPHRPKWISIVICCVCVWDALYRDMSNWKTRYYNKWFVIVCAVWHAIPLCVLFMLFGTQIILLCVSVYVGGYSIPFRCYRCRCHRCRWAVISDFFRTQWWMATVRLH